MEMMTLVERGTGRRVRIWDGRATMRTLADALAKLEELGILAPDAKAEVRVLPMRLPDGRETATISVGRQITSWWRIAIPSSAYFTANDTFGHRRRYPISRLDGAITDPNGNVDLRDGFHVHGVELTPTRLSYEWTELQQSILDCAIEFLNAEHRCYRNIHEELLPGLRRIDFAEVAKLGAERLPGLKAIERHVRRRFPSVSRQTMANVLAAAGLRRPRSGPRSRKQL